MPRPVGRAGAVGGDPDRRGARARAHGVPHRELLGPAGARSATRGPTQRPDDLPGHARRARRAAAGHRQGLRFRRATQRSAARSGRRPARRGRPPTRSVDGADRSARRRCARSRRSPTPAVRAPPFMTSTLQQEAGRKLRFSSAQTMSTAQRLYENGYITYMRTDSTTLSDTALDAARTQILEQLRRGVPARRPAPYTRARSRTPRRPTRPSAPPGDSFRTPDEVAGRAGRRRSSGSTS